MRAYFDHRGKEHVPAPGNACKERQGIFALCVTNDHILMSWPEWALDIPELPGGGIDPGESEAEALCREIYEETAVEIQDAKPSATYQQRIPYYSERMNEFWDYSQSFWLLDDPALAGCFFEGEKNPVDAARSRWVTVGELKKLTIHAGHHKAVKELL